MNALRSARKIRKDAPQCESGNVPCGGICIPRDKKCGGKEKVKGVLKRVVRKLERVAVKAGDRLKAHLEDELEIHNRTKKENDQVDRAIAVKKLGGMAATALATGRPSESNAVDKAGEYVKERNAQRIRAEYKKEKEAKKMKKDSLDSEVAKSVAQIIADSFDAPVQLITSLMDSGDRIVGTCISSGNFYRFDSDKVFIEVEYLPNETQEIHDYTRGILDSLGVRVDSDRPYDWLMGFMRMDAQIKCTSGNVPCGKKCLPRGQKCRISGGAPNASLKSPAIAGIAQAAAVGGLAGLGIAAYRGRDEIKAGVSNAKKEVKKSIEEERENHRNVTSKKLAAEAAESYRSKVNSLRGLNKKEGEKALSQYDEIAKKNPRMRDTIEKRKKTLNEALVNNENKLNATERTINEVVRRGKNAGSNVESAKILAGGAAKGVSEVVKGVGRAVVKGVKKKEKK